MRENTGSYFESVEIQVFMNLLRIVDNTRQDIPLISAMRSAVFDFSVRELAQVRAEFSDGSFYQRESEHTLRPAKTESWPTG